MAEEISDIKGIGSGTEESLNELGIESLDDLAEADADVVEDSDVKISPDRMQSFIDEAAKHTVQILSGEDVVEEYENRGEIETTIDELDSKLAGGFSNREIVAVGGDTGSGKTQLAFWMLGQAVKQTGKPALYIETEPDRYRGKRIAEMFSEEVQSKVYKIDAHGLDQQKMAYNAAQDKLDDLSLIVVDSFTSRFRLSDKFEDRSSFGERNQEFRAHLNMIEDLAKDSECPVLLNCQVYKNPTQYGATDVIYGSTLMMHMVSFVVMMNSKSGQLTEFKGRNHPHEGDFEVLLQITDSGLQYAE